MSSINKPSAIRNAKRVKKLIDIPKSGISIKAEKNVSGTVNDEMIA